MDLKARIFLTQPRENDGSRTSNRYDYQKNWAICKLTELHSAGDDFLLSFEFHDDILVFDSSTQPTSIECFQVKSKEKQPWPLRDLFTGKKTKNETKPSVLAKMYLHLKAHTTSIIGLTFVTNNYFNSTLEGDIACSEVSSFTLSQLSKDELKKLSDKMEKELETDDLDSFYKMTNILQHALDINHHSEITQAKLGQFIEKVLPNVRYQIGPLYKTIFDEVKNKSNYESQVLNFDDLKTLKSISRSDFDSYLSVLKNQDEFKELIQSVENRLNSENVNFKFVKDFRKEAKTYEIDRMDHTNSLLQTKQKEVRTLIDNYAGSTNLLYEQMEEIFTKMNNNTNVYPETYLKAMILCELYGKG